MAIGEISETWAARYLERVAGVSDLESFSGNVCRDAVRAASLGLEATKSALANATRNVAVLDSFQLGALAFQVPRDAIPEVPLGVVAARSTIVDVDDENVAVETSTIQVIPTATESTDQLDAGKEVAINLFAMLNSIETGDDDERSQLVAVMQFEFYQDFKRATGLYPDTSGDAPGADRQRSHRA